MYRILHAKYVISNGQFVSSCPSCNKPNHFYMSQKTGLFDCKKCGIVGNWFQYLRILKSIGVEDTQRIILTSKQLLYVEKIEQENNVVHAPLIMTPLKKDTQEYNYFLDRGFSSKLIKQYNISKSIPQDFLYRNRLIFPINKKPNKIGGYIARTIFENVKPKYYNSKGTSFSKLLFNLENIENDFDFVVLVEGIFDSLRLRKFSVATFGKHVSEQQISLLQKLNKKNVILMYDSDAFKEIMKMSFLLTQVFENVFWFSLKSGDPDSYFKGKTLEEKIAIIQRKKKAFKNSLNMSVKLLT